MRQLDTFRQWNGYGRHVACTSLTFAVLRKNIGAEAFVHSRRICGPELQSLVFHSRQNGGAFEKLDANCNGNRQLGNKSVIQERLPLACVVNGTR